MDNHDQPDNGAGGSAGTHDGHANCVPPHNVPLGLGMGDAKDETPGNNASRQYAKEHNLRGAGPTGFLGSLQTPVNQ